MPKTMILCAILLWALRSLWVASVSAVSLQGRSVSHQHPSSLYPLRSTKTTLHPASYRSKTNANLYPINSSAERSLQQLPTKQERFFSSLSLTSTALSARGGDVETNNINNNNNNNQQPPSLWKCCVAEFVGTFLIVFLGTGSVMSAVLTNSMPNLFSIASCWALAVTLAIATTSSVSEAHLNPSISLALCLFRSFEWNRLLPFIVAQLAGAVVASATAFSLYASHFTAFESTHGIVRTSLEATATAKCFGEYFVPPVTWLQALLAETIGTAILSGVVFALTHSKNSYTKEHPLVVPPLIGGTVGVLIAVLAPLSQAGFNPARDFGPRLVAYVAGWRKVAFSQAWIFIVGPLLGAPLGAWLVEKVLYANETIEKYKRKG